MDKIDIRDLRVGNWVYSSFSKVPCKVTEIILDESGYGVCKVTGVVGYKDVASLSPIPLTKEILEKNGFAYNDLPMLQCFEQYGLQLYRGGNGFRINCGVNVSLIIDSVHQLQHALKLCGIEKEITL